MTLIKLQWITDLFLASRYLDVGDLDDFQRVWLVGRAGRSELGGGVVDRRRGLFEGEILLLLRLLRSGGLGSLHDRSQIANAYLGRRHGRRLGSGLGGVFSGLHVILD